MESTGREKDFNEVVKKQMMAMAEAEADYSEIIINDIGYELSFIIKKVVEE